VRDALIRFEHPGRASVRLTDEPNELVAELFLYDVKYRGPFLLARAIESYDVYRLRVRVDASRKTVLVQDERETYLKSWTRLRHDFFKGVQVCP